jgi:hypothetical protein
LAPCLGSHQWWDIHLTIRMLIDTTNTTTTKRHKTATAFKMCEW